MQEKSRLMVSWVPYRNRVAGVWFRQEKPLRFRAIPPESFNSVGDEVTSLKISESNALNRMSLLTSAPTVTGLEIRVNRRAFASLR